MAEGRFAGDPEEMAHVVWAFYHGLASLALANKLHHGMGVDQIAPGLESIFEGFRPAGERTGDGDEAKPRYRSTGGRSER